MQDPDDFTPPDLLFEGVFHDLPDGPSTWTPVSEEQLVELRQQLPLREDLINGAIRYLYSVSTPTPTETLRLQAVMTLLGLRAMGIQGSREAFADKEPFEAAVLAANNLLVPVRQLSAQSWALLFADFQDAHHAPEPPAVTVGRLPNAPGELLEETVIWVPNPRLWEAGMRALTEHLVRHGQFQISSHAVPTLIAGSTDPAMAVTVAMFSMQWNLPTDTAVAILSGLARRLTPHTKLQYPVQAQDPCVPREDSETVQVQQEFLPDRIRVSTEGFSEMPDMALYTYQVPEA